MEPWRQTTALPLSWLVTTGLPFSEYVFLAKGGRGDI